MILNLENIGLIDNQASIYIKDHRDPKKSYAGHELSHLQTVARLTELAGICAKFSSRDTELSRITGWFHDFERSPNETNRQSDEQSSVDAMLDFADNLKQERLYYTNSDERDAMSYAILHASGPPEFFVDRPDPKYWDLQERLHAALFVADKLEANGVWVIARRSQFVAGARLTSPEADLPQYGLKSNQDEVKAVLLESAARIAFINPEAVYPPTFRPLTSKMYGPQRDFITGLLKAEGMNVEGLAQMILNTKREGLNYLQTRNLKAPEDPTALAHILEQSGGLSDNCINNASEDLTQSAVEAVRYFSSNYQAPLEELVPNWHPKNNQANLWKEAMLVYVSGEWFDEMRKQLL